jgi:hypothetical protein
MKRRGVFFAAAAVIAAGGAIAYASIPDSGGVIHGCYGSGNGKLRVIDSATSSCGANEVAIAWSQTGPPGGPGPAGPPSLAPSSAVDNFRAFNLPSGVNNTTYVTLGDLASQNSDSADHQITTTSTSRIMASAVVHITNPGGIAVRGSCRMFISDGTGPLNGLTEMNTRGATWHTVADPSFDLAVPVVGFATKTAGTYNVVMKCEQLAFDGSTTGEMSEMIVWATAP